MVHSNGHDQSWRSRYDKPNKYESPRKRVETSPVAGATPVVAKPPIDQFQPRNLPAATIYTPPMGESRQGRRDAKRLIDDLHTASQIHEAGRVYEQSLTNLEEAHQHREHVQLRRTQLPAKIELENLKLGNELLYARTAFEAAIEQQQDERVDRERDRQIDRENFETSLADRRAARLEAQARERAAQEYAAHAAEIGRRRAEADLHKASEASFEKEADAETQRRRRDQERQKRTEARASEGPNMPAPLAAHYATEQRVKDNKRRAEELAADIRRRAEAEGRELTDEEVEDIDALNNAAAGAEDTIRRGDATDFTV